MKIHQLPMGARFEYEGEEYVKTGPLIAAGKAGQRMIPKYAVLKPLGGVEAAAPPASRATLPREEVLGAFAAFYADCRSLVPADRRQALEDARERFLRALG